ncbi:hypothetical protein [Neolewinella persica]|uniref:hypothetical protein n=1 Tax=Neolewinella persica TaxID=70998 RepID=UPI00035D9A31|nr:hypothetical protein [Neolewinella persica]
MKYIIITLLLFVNLDLASQSYNDTITIGPQYDTLMSSPIEIGKGTVVLSQANRIYLVNGLRYKFYEEIRGALNNKNIPNLDDIVLKYEKILNENDVLFSLLEAKSIEQSRLYNKSSESMKASLTNLESTLDLTQRSLASANKSLDLSLSQIDKSRKASFWKKIDMLGTGLAVGVLVGLLITN